MNNIKLEVMKQNGYCRGCGTDLLRNENMAVKVSRWRNKDSNILFCLTCVGEMFQLINPEGETE